MEDAVYVWCVCVYVSVWVCVLSLWYGDEGECVYVCDVCIYVHGDVSECVVYLCVYSNQDKITRNDMHMS